MGAILSLNKGIAMKETQPLTQICQQIIEAATKLLPTYLQNHDDMQISKGNVSICIIDENGQVHGCMWGNDKGISRDTYQTAWRKASQVWITGIATGKYEELVYTNQIEWWKFGIMKPDLIGWEGGLPIEIGNTKLALAVSGMRGESDTEMGLKAVAAVQSQLAK